MKKIIAVLLTAVLLIGLVACGTPAAPAKTEAPKATEAKKTEEAKKPAETTVAKATDKPAGTTEAPPEKMVDKETLVVGAPELNGDYISGFGNSTYDVWIKRLIGNYGGEFGYSAYYTDNAGQFKLNKQVCPEEPKRVANADGSVTYTYTIASDLVWNNGEKITAKDYLFGAFFTASPEWAAQGADNANAAEDFVGFTEYKAGKTREFKGVKYIDDTHFSVTLDKDKVPYFYETALANVGPTPMKRYAPNVDIKDSTLIVKEGYKATDADKAALVENAKKQLAKKEGALKAQKDKWDKTDAAKKDEKATKANDDKMKALQAEVDKAKALVDGKVEMNPLEMLMTQAALEVAYNYRFKPDVTCGPYKFVSFGNKMAKVTLNDKFKGNAEGKKPTIKNVIVQTVNSKLDIDYLLSGNIDLSTDVIEGEKIKKAKDNKDKAGTTSYPRNGYGLLAIRNDYSPTQYPEVRRAIAFSIDRDQFVTDICGGYGTVVDGRFGVNQFEYVDCGEKIESDPKWTHYTLNTEKANAELDKSPYKFEKDGKTPWDAKKAEEAFKKDKAAFSYWRYNDKGEELRIVHMGSQNLNTTNLIQVQLPDNSKRVGMNYIVKPVDFATLLSTYYAKETPKDPKDVASCFNMGNGFAVPDDPYYSFHSSQIDGGDNRSHTKDAELDKVLETMRKADPTDVKKWEDGWMKFQLWFNGNLPNIPLYANEYYDIFNIRVKGLKTTPMWDWSNDICNLTLVG